jgi:leucyl aminopeptidase
MEIKAIAAEIAGVKADAIIVGHFEGDKKPEGAAAAVDKALDGALTQLIKEGEIKGKLNELTLLHSLGKLPAGRIAVLGLGKEEKLSPDKVRGAAAEACRYLRQKGAKSIAAPPLGAGVNSIDEESAAQAAAEGARLGLYTFRRYITEKENHRNEVAQLLIAGTDKKKLEKGIARGEIMSGAAIWARDLGNEPSNHMTPTLMAAAARELAKSGGLGIEVLDKAAMVKMGMGGLLGVAQGSQQPPKFIIMSYKGRSGEGVDLALVGKGITFDSGGISIKPSEAMDEMKWDMVGGAAVLAAVSAIARLKAKINVTAIVPATENMPSGTAMKPGDIIKAMNGKTIEVLNTDAEGRLILADALSYATMKLKAKNIVDVATLTGSARATLGKLVSAAFSNDQKLADRVSAAGEQTGERVWPFPMYEEYRELIKSDIADIKNSGYRYSGAIAGAKFLEEFVDKTPWVHLDIAGTSDIDKEKGYLVKGATGVPARLLISLALAMAK